MNNTDNVVYKIDIKTKSISKYYVCDIKFEEDTWYVIVKDNNRNKYKFNLEKIPFKYFGTMVFPNNQEAKTALESYTNRKEYSLTFKCGHKDKVRLKGPPYKVNAQLQELKNKVCLSCRNKESEKNGCILVEMPYSEYKKKYKDCDTKVGSYNSDSHTIKVYIKQ